MTSDLPQLTSRQILHRSVTATKERPATVGRSCDRPAATPCCRGQMAPGASLSPSTRAMFGDGPYAVSCDKQG